MASYFLLSAAYTIRRGAWGFTADVLGRLNTTHHDYHFGNRISSSVRAFFLNHELFFMQIKSFLFAAFCFFTIAACDHNHDADDTNPAVLTIDEPLNNDLISGEVHIEGDVTDENLHSMEIKVTQDFDGAELFKATPVIHDKTEYHFHEHWFPTLTAETAVTLTITVEDHFENITTKTVKFATKP
ncbi:MAG: hypothetical protein H7246_10275 [Phycisphaerae bacterium]|nr:hypothetical protein [Saprospiraceae bacterium]